MKLDELKKNMTLLEHVLEKTDNEIKIDVKASQTAQKSILKKYRKGILSNAILAVVFTFMLIGKVNQVAFPTYLLIYMISFLTVAAVWYSFLYIKFKRLNVSLLSPRKLFAEVTKIRIYTISGEAVSVVFLAVFFTLFLPNLITVNPLAFWLVVITLAVGLISTGIFYMPKYIRLFNDLTTVKE
ncbi:MAG: hypothetical protein K2O00_02975 [Muribaculaceae bacterium]|nr:hypothetical protein [Muribaculaceae bacterium]